MSPTLPVGVAVLVRNPYGVSTLVLQRECLDDPEAYQTGLVVSLGWTSGTTFRTEGRVRRV